MPTRSPRLFTIPSSVAFLPALIDALLAGRLVEGFPGSRDPMELAQATLYLPTRRACRLAQVVFLDALGGDAAILPRLVPVGDIDEDEIVFAEFAGGPLAAERLSLARAMDPFERKASLTQLILAWAAQQKRTGEESLIANSPASAFAMAGELARLQDDMITRGVDWSALDTLVPEEMDQHFRSTLEFLKIVREAWPAYLAEFGLMDATARRDALIDAETARLKRDGAGPVIAAGSTASMPSTAKLLAAIANLPNGAVVLPGLDTDLDEPSWEAIGGVAGYQPIARTSAIRNAGLPAWTRRQTRSGRDPRSRRRPWPRTVCIGGHAAGRGDRSLARHPERRVIRNQQGRRPRQSVADRSRHHRRRGDGGGAGAARGGDRRR